jgi:hypothetical protein
MDEQYTIQRLLKLRKLTRAVADLLRGQIKDYLGTLAPALRPRGVFGEYIQGGAKEGFRGSEKNYQDLQALYRTVGGGRPFNFTMDLTGPLDISGALELSPFEYTHSASEGTQTKSILVVSPLRWAVNYAGFPLGRLKEILADPKHSNDQVHSFVVHFLALHLVFGRLPGVVRVLEALRFPPGTANLPEFGALPITTLASPVPTVRPPDEVLIESTEISGRNVFEEVVDVSRLSSLPDPLKEQLIEIARGMDERV